MEFKIIKLPIRIKRSVLAFGAQQKGSLCLARGNRAYLADGLGDLSRPPDFQRFKKTALYFLKRNPRILAVDMHPEYLSGKFAEGLKRNKKPIQKIQHHHAHIASCMADNGLKGRKVIGVAFDGSGLGDNGTLWGAEFLLCDYKSYSRQAYFLPMPLLGSEKAVREPWRLAAFWLSRAGWEKKFGLNPGFLRIIDKRKWLFLKQMAAKDFNSPLTSSMGRLFDAAGAMLFAKGITGKEAELAMRLEQAAVIGKPSERSYGYKIIRRAKGCVIDPTLIFKSLAGELTEEAPLEEIAYRFHFTLAKITRDAALLISRKSGIKKAVLSGGVFQNQLLLRLCGGLLRDAGFLVYAQKQVSCNDSGISLGQAVAAGLKG